MHTAWPGLFLAWREVMTPGGNSLQNPDTSLRRRLLARREKM